MLYPIDFYGLFSYTNIEKDKKGVAFMATSSVYKNIRIKNSRSAKELVRALENSHNIASAPVSYSKTVQEIKDPATVKSLFSK